jgi:hypothetical protein
LFLYAFQCQILYSSLSKDAEEFHFANLNEISAVLVPLPVTVLDIADIAKWDGRPRAGKDASVLFLPHYRIADRVNHRPSFMVIRPNNIPALRHISVTGADGIRRDLHPEVPEIKFDPIFAAFGETSGVIVEALPFVLPENCRLSHERVQSYGRLKIDNTQIKWGWCRVVVSAEQTRHQMNLR